MKGILLQQLIEHLYFDCKLIYNDEEHTWYIRNKPIDNIKNYVAKILSNWMMDYYGYYKVWSDHELDRIFKAYKEVYWNGAL